MTLAAAPRMWQGQSMVRRLSPGLLRGLLRLTSRLTVTGLENVPPSGPLILVGNHLNHLDPPLMLAVMPWPITFMAVAGLFDVPVTSQVLRLYGVIRLNRGQVDRGALRRALRTLDQGHVLGILPEGRMSPTGALIQGRSGTAWLVARSRAPVLPVGVTGTERFLADLRRGRRPELGLSIGQPFRLEVPANDRAALQEATDEIMRRLAALLPPEYRGVYA